MNGLLSSPCYDDLAQIRRLRRRRLFYQMKVPLLLLVEVICIGSLVRITPSTHFFISALPVAQSTSNPLQRRKVHAYTLPVSVSSEISQPKNTSPPVKARGFAKANSSSAWINGLKNALASASAAACCKALLQPIDAMKTVQQYHMGERSLSLYDAAKLILSKPGGFRNLYAGLGVTVIGSMPSVGLYFGVYSYCKQRLLATARGRQHATLCIALSAAIGNTVASFSRVPYEVMKQQLQTGIYDSTLSLWRDPQTIAQLLFPKGSVWIQMLRDVPYAVVTLLLYESLQQHFKKASSQTTTPLRDALLGGFAGGVGSWITNPMDVVKTRLQTNSALYSGSIVSCSRVVWQEGGPAAFLRGSVPRLVHKVPANAFFFVFYECFRRLLQVDTSLSVQSTTNAKTER